MNIALIGPVYPYRGGIAHFTTELAQAIRSSHHICDVISFKRQYPKWLYPGESDKDPSQPVINIEAKYLLDPFYPWTWKKTKHYLLEKHTDMVIFQWWTTFWAWPYAYVMNSLQRSSIPVIALVHNVLPHEEKPWDRWLAQHALSQADGYLVLTASEKERLLELFPGANIGLSPHPVYTMFVDRRCDKSEARLALGLPADQTVLLFFGIVRPYKGLKVLLESLSILKSLGKLPYLLIAGEFWEERSDYEKQIQSLELFDQVRIVDRYVPDDQAALMFSAADALVAPYTGGTQSGVVTIAQSFGLPIIITEQIAAGVIGENSEMVYKVAAGDANALANAILYWMSSSPNRYKTSMPVDDNWGKLVSSMIELRNQIVKHG